jgi:hypothetical protein
MFERRGRIEICQPAGVLIQIEQIGLACLKLFILRAIDVQNCISILLLPSNTTILTEVRCTVNQYTLGNMFRPVQGHPQAKRTYNDLKNELTMGSHLVKINYYKIYKTYFK